MTLLHRIRRSRWCVVVQGIALAGMILQPVPMARSYWTDTNNDGVKEWVDNPPEGDSWFDANGDGDQMTNGEEAIYGSDPYRLDSDFDGLTDKDEHDLTPLNDPWAWSSDGTGYSDHDRYYHGLQGTPLVVNYNTLSANSQPFHSYFDADGDGIQNQEDPDPTNNDRDGDGIVNWQDSYMDDPNNGNTPPPEGPPPDADNDGIPDSSDPYPWGSYWYNGAEYGGTFVDTDGDTVPDPADAFPNGSYMYNGTEFGGIFVDQDGDTIPDPADPWPGIAGSYFYNGTEYPGAWIDSDADGIPDALDAFPSGSYVYNNVEYGGTWVDQDNDGIPDPADPFPTLSGSYWYGGTEYGGAWIDTDNDSIPDPADAFPNGSYTYNGVEYAGAWMDADGDSVPDPADAFPGQFGSYWYNGTEYGGYWMDADGDNIPDPADQWPNDWWNGAPHYAYNGTEYPGVWADRDGDNVPDPADNWPDDPENGLDSDGDGLDNYSERTQHHTDPNDVDSDDDYLTDSEELLIYHTNPLLQKTDPAQALTDFYVVSAQWVDSDNDGLPDKIEDWYTAAGHGLDKNDPADALGDVDGDGVTNQQAYNFGWNLTANLNQYDQDGDGITDAVEDFWSAIYPGILNKTLFADSVADFDGDEVMNFEEVALGMDPGNPRSTFPPHLWHPESYPPDEYIQHPGVPDFLAWWYLTIWAPAQIAASQGGYWTPQDTDGSGVPDVLENLTGSPESQTIPAVRAAAGDYDADGMSDVWEHRYGFKLRDNADAGPASGILAYASAPSKRGFMIPYPYPEYPNFYEAWLAAQPPEFVVGPDEWMNFVDDAGYATAQAAYEAEGVIDADHDGLSNRREETLQTHPRITDSDGDGFGDGFEVQKGTNPSLRSDSPLTQAQQQLTAVQALISAYLALQTANTASYEDRMAAWQSLQTALQAYEGLLDELGQNVLTTEQSAAISSLQGALENAVEPTIVMPEVFITGRYSSYWDDVNSNLLCLGALLLHPRNEDIDPPYSLPPCWIELPDTYLSPPAFTGVQNELSFEPLTDDAKWTWGFDPPEWGGFITDCHIWPREVDWTYYETGPNGFSWNLVTAGITNPLSPASYARRYYAEARELWLQIAMPASTPVTRTFIKITGRAATPDPVVEAEAVILTIPAGSFVSNTVSLMPPLPDLNYFASSIGSQVTLLPVELEVKHTEKERDDEGNELTTTINPGATTLLRDEIADLRIKVPTMGNADWDLKLELEPADMKTQTLDSRGAVQMYDFGTITPLSANGNGTSKAGPYDIKLLAGNGGDETFKIVVNKEGKFKLRLKSADNKIDVLSQEFTVTKRIRKYARVPESGNVDYDKHDKAFVAAAESWGTFYNNAIDPDILKAIGFQETQLGYQSNEHIDIMTVGNTGDHVLPILAGTYSAKEAEFLADNTVRWLAYTDASKSSAPIAIHWGTCWLYHKAQIFAQDDNNPPTGKRANGWRSWETAVSRYGPNTAYLGVVEGPWKRGKKESTGIFLWPVLTNQKARK